MSIMKVVWKRSRGQQDRPNIQPPTHAPTLRAEHGIVLLVEARDDGRGARPAEAEVEEVGHEEGQGFRADGRGGLAEALCVGCLCGGLGGQSHDGLLLVGLVV